MKAITFDTFGGPEVLTISDLPAPVPGDGEVLVKVTATTVNPTDLMMRNGAQAALMEGLEPPFIAGMEFSGTILDPGASGMAPGTPVVGVLNPRTPSGGAYAEEIAIAADAVAPVSPQVDLAAAATVPMNALTAMLALDFLGLSPGQTLLVTGGAGMLGGSAIQLGKAAGLTVLANVAEKDADLVRDFGADHILPRNEFDAALKALAPGGADGLIDGALIGQEVAHLVRDGGGAVSLRSSYKIEDPRLKVLNVSVLKGMNDKALITRIADQISAGGLRPRVAQTLSYREAVKGHQITEAGGLRGRVVLRFD